MEPIAHEPPNAPSTVPMEEDVCMPQLTQDVLTGIFFFLEPTSLAQVACTCKLWNQCSVPVWRQHVTSTWHHGQSPKWQQMMEAGQYRALYSARRQLDQQTEAAIRDYIWPTKTDAAWEVVQELGEDCIDYLLTTSQAAGWHNVGRRYAASLLLSQWKTNRAELAMIRLLEEPDMSESRMEEGAILIADACDPACHTEAVREAVRQLHQELVERINRLDEDKTDHQVLQVLNQLLFGESPTDPLDDGLSPCFRVPSAPYGLGLQGDHESYYDVANSCLDKIVLVRRVGLPITLSVLHVALGRRVGLDLHVLGVPGHVVSCMGLPSAAGVMFIDCFARGQILDYEGIRTFMLQMGITIPPRELRVLSPREVYSRMCMNLLTQRSHMGPRLHAAVMTMFSAVSKDDPRILTARLQAARDFDDYNTALEMVDRRLDAQLALADEAGPIAREVAQLAEVDRAYILQARQRYLEQSMVVSRRTAEVKFRVGQLVWHRNQRYMGVIIGWGQSLWKGHDWPNRTPVNMRDGEQQIYYGVLVSGQRAGQRSALIFQDCLMLLSREPMLPHQTWDDSEGVDNAEIGKYFQDFDPSRFQYIPNAWLRYKYPEDYC